MSEQRDLLAGRYRLQHRIGSGGMGHVWLAWDERLSRAVAIKQLRALGDLPEEEASVAQERVMREARITARLDHPNAVPVFDVVDHDGQPCLVMQYIPSRSLQEVLRAEGTLAPVRVARIGAEIAAALATAHEARIVHRDVKPGNILITHDDTALITDFGISRAFGDASLTSTGMLTGTPAYLAPEVARGGGSTPAADVFSLGATLYAAVEGTPPFGAGDNPMALLHQVASGRINPPRLAGALSGVLLAMLDVTPAHRPTMREASDTLTRLVAGGGTAPDERDPLTTTRVLPVSSPAGGSANVGAGGAGAAAAAGAGIGIGSVLGSEGGHTVELPSDPPDDPDELDPLAPLAAEPDAHHDPSPDTGSEDTGSEDTEPSRPSASAPSPAGPPPRRPGDTVDPRRRRRRRAGLLAGALAGVVALLVVWGLQRSSDPTGEAAPAPRSTPSASASATRSSGPVPTSSAPAPAPSTAATPSSTAPRTSAPVVTRTTAPSATTQPPTTRATTAPTATPTSPATPTATPTAKTGAGVPSANELSTAVRGYYGLLPGNTDAGWAKLTDRYQQTTATSRSFYERFWGGIDRVQVSQVSSPAPSSVVATLRYVYDDGRVFVERTSYTLVRDGGQLKIDRSSVISSRQS